MRPSTHVGDTKYFVIDIFFAERSRGRTSKEQGGLFEGDVMCVQEPRAWEMSEP